MVFFFKLKWEVIKVAIKHGPGLQWLKLRNLYAGKENNYYISRTVMAAAT